jgi:integrase
MAKGNPQRVKVESGIWQRLDAAGRPVLEIAWRDAQGAQRRKRVYGGITAARKALNAARAARDRKEQIATDPRLTFGAAADKWWETRVARLRPTTQSAYGGGLAHLRTHFDRMRLNAIRPSHVADYIAAQQNAGLKGWTVQGHLTVLSSVYKYATRHLGFAGVNPVTMLDRVERPKVAEDERPKRILEGDELPRLIAAVDEPYRLVFEFAAETGARLGETLGTLWREFDLDEGTVTFTHQLDRHGQRVPLKTKRSRRTIEISPHLAAKLRKAKLAAEHSGPHDFVFLSRAGTPHDHRNIAGRVLARAIKRAGLDAAEHRNGGDHRAPTFHDLRHSHASKLINDGWDIATVSARLGHADVATTMRVYIHEFERAQRSADRRNRLARLYPETAHAPAGEVVPITGADGSEQAT